MQNGIAVYAIQPVEELFHILFLLRLQWEMRLLTKHFPQQYPEYADQGADPFSVLSLFAKKASVVFINR